MEENKEKKGRLKKRYQTALTFTEEESKVLEILRTSYTMIYVFRRGMEVCLAEMARKADVEVKKFDGPDAGKVIEVPRKDEDEFADKSYGGFDLIDEV